MRSKQTVKPGSRMASGKRAFVWLLLGLAVILTSACTATHAVRTVGKGNYGFEASLGGPIFSNLGAPIPAPNLYLGGRYGILEDLDISAAYNLTAPIIPGLPVNLILASHYVPIQPGLRSQKNTQKKGWSLATGFQAHILTDFETGFLIFPAFDLALGYRYKWFNPFIGVSLALHFYRPSNDVHPTMLNPYLGFELLLPRETALSLKFTFYDVTYSYWGSQVDWVYLSTDESAHERHAILGISLGFSWDFTKSSKLPMEKQSPQITESDDTEEPNSSEGDEA